MCMDSLGLASCAQSSGREIRELEPNNLSIIIAIKNNSMEMKCVCVCVCV